MKCTRCAGAIRHDPRLDESSCIQCGWVLYTPEELRRGQEALAHMTQGRMRIRLPRYNGIRLD